MTPLLSGRLVGYPAGESLRCVLCFRAEAGDSMWCLRISGSNSSTGARHQVTNHLATSLFGGSLAFFWVAGQRQVIFMRRGVPRDMATPLKISVFSFVVVSAKLMGDSPENSLTSFIRGGEPWLMGYCWPTSPENSL